MKITTSYGRTPIQCMADLPRFYPQSEFNSPYRSTIPHLLWWQNPTNRLREVLINLGLSVPEAAEMEFEHKLSPVRGSGKASHTDLMIQWNGGAIGIEAKWTEGEYPKIVEWLGSQPTLNRREVLAGWCELLGYACGLNAMRDIGDLTYQVIHRTCCFGMR